MAPAAQRTSLLRDTRGVIGLVIVCIAVGALLGVGGYQLYRATQEGGHFLDDTVERPWPAPRTPFYGEGAWTSVDSSSPPPSASTPEIQPPRVTGSDESKPTRPRKICVMPGTSSWAVAIYASCMGGR
jgi:hypothetical protein